MPSVLKHVECSACGHRHHFCYLNDDLTPGREYDYLCPETAKRARLRPAVAPEIFRTPPQGAVMLTAVAQCQSLEAGKPQERLQEVLPEVSSLAAKVGGMDQLSKVVDTLKDSKE